MSDKKEILVDKFLEEHNMDYLFCILADKESERLSVLPESIKKTFEEKTTTMALKHIAMNDVPDFIVDEIESSEDKDLDSIDYVEEYEDDRKDRLSKDIDIFDDFSSEKPDDYEDDEVEDDYSDDI